MQNNIKNSKIVQSFKENRAVWITAITLVVALAVITAVVTVANRSRKPPKDTEPVTDNGTTVPAESDKTGIETQTASDSETDNSVAKDVSDELPTFIVPTSGKLTKGHDADHQVFSDTMNDYRVHLGVDIATSANAPVSAAADGTIAEIWEDPMMGQCIAIRHAGDAYSIYKNLSTILPENITEGTEITAGQLIAYIGDTAAVEMADEPHLHYEMTVGEIQVDPVEVFGEEAAAALSEDTAYES